MRLALAIGVAYFVAARLGLALRARLEDVAIFWPASGIATGALIALGRRWWLPVGIAVTAASPAANLLAGRGVATALVFAACDIGEAVLAAGLIGRWFGPSFHLNELRRVLSLLLAAVLGPAVAGVGAALASRALGGSVASLLEIWRVCFAAHALGIATVAPLLIGLASVPRETLARHELIEGIVTLTVIFALTGCLFLAPPGHWVSIMPDALLLPMVLWTAVRCRIVFTAAAVTVVAFAAVAMISHNIGRLGAPDAAEVDRLVAAHVGLLSTTLAALALAAAVSERRRSEAAAKAGEARLQSILETANIVAWDIDLIRDTVDASGPVMRFLNTRPGRQPYNVSTAVDVVYPADRERVQSEFNAAPSCAIARAGQCAWWASTGTSPHARRAKST
jgi:integral membrane sensor domain MASE1